MTTSTPNYSLFAIPAYMVTAMLPHIYSVWLITTNNNKNFDLTSPRSTHNRANIEKSVPRAVYRKYERCRAAHDNMFDNMAYVVGGILSGVIGKLDPVFMNRMAAIYIASRILYAISYIQISAPKWALLRTLWYLVGALAITSMYWRTGMILMRDGNIL